MKSHEAVSDGEVRASFVFPDNFVGFQGHFPGKKILPGICQIQSVIAVVEEWRNQKASLKEIVLAKFLSPVLPSDELTCVVRSIDESNDGIVIKASLACDDKKTAEMKLKIGFQELETG